MKDFFKNINYPIILFVLYVLKSIILPAGIIDVLMVLVIGLFYLGKYFGDKYLNTKAAILSENKFRAQVNADIGNLVNELQAVKMSSGANPIQNVFRKR